MYLLLEEKSRGLEVVYKGVGSECFTIEVRQLRDERRNVITNLLIYRVVVVVASNVQDLVAVLEKIRAEFFKHISSLLKYPSNS